MTRIAVAVAACAVLACAGGRAEQKPVTVSDSDYGRLQAGQTQIVDAARADLARARDEFARAKLGETDAKQEDELARADLTAAESVKMRADSLATTAKESNAPADFEAAKSMGETAHRRPLLILRRRAACSEAGWLLVERAKADSAKQSRARGGPKRQASPRCHREEDL